MAACDPNDNSLQNVLPHPRFIIAADGDEPVTLLIKLIQR